MSAVGFGPDLQQMGRIQHVVTFARVAYSRLLSRTLANSLMSGCGPARGVPPAQAPHRPLPHQPSSSMQITPSIRAPSLQDVRILDNCMGLHCRATVATLQLAEPQGLPLALPVMSGVEPFTGLTFSASLAGVQHLGNLFIA